MVQQSQYRIPLFKVFMSETAKTNASSVLDSGYIGQGQKVEDFELQLRRYFGSPYVNTVNSATSGIHLALHAIKTIKDIDNGVRDEILTTPLTCVATNMPILANGLKIKWVDVNEDDCNINIDDLAKKITSKTLAIMVVHWGGYPADLDALECLSVKNNVNIIEDCAHAFGSSYKHKLIGISRNICVFSFQAIKHLTCGDGGVIVSNREDYHEKMRLLRWYGLNRDLPGNNHFDQNATDWGYKFHMNDISASIGLGNLPFVKNNIAIHQRNAALLNKKLFGIPGIRLIAHKPYRTSSYWLYTLFVNFRENFIKMLASYGIEASCVHKRNDEHKCFEQFKTYLPNLAQIEHKICCIPCGWWLTESDIDYMVDCIKKGW